MKRILAVLLVLTLAGSADARITGNQINGHISITAWIEYFPPGVDATHSFTIYEREYDANGQPVVALEWGPFAPQVWQYVREGDAAAQGVDWNKLEDIFRHADQYRFFDPSFAPGLLFERDFMQYTFLDPPGNSHFLAAELVKLERGWNDSFIGAPALAFYNFEATGVFLHIPEPTSAVLLTLGSLGLVWRRPRRR